MESIIGVIQKVAKKEVAKIYTTELGEVTEVFPHAAESDKDNYQCSVKLKNRKQPDGSDFELRKVPIATHHIGSVSIPNIGDLVLIAFINGHINAPVIIGRMYNETDKPPENDIGQMVVTKVEAITITTNAGTKIEIDKDGNINIESAGDVNINDGKKGAARQDDEVEVTIPSGSFLISAAGPGVVGTPNPAPVKVQGKITSSSGTVKIGD